MKITKPLSNPGIRTLPASVGIVKNGVTGQPMQPITRGQSGQGSGTTKSGNSSK